MPTATIKVLIVDDSALVRQVMTEVFGKSRDIEVIGAAPDPLFAMKRMSKQWPDVIVLDMEMPRMDGLTFLRKIMSEHPTPVVVCSTLTEQGAKITLDALEAGAVDIITKPKMGIKGFLHDSATVLMDAVRAAARARLKKLPTAPEKRPGGPKVSADAVLPAGTLPTIKHTTDRVIALGASTGGTQALSEVLNALPVTVPGIVVVQHMPANFTKAFAERLNQSAAIRIKEAENEDRVIPGLALIAPGDRHTLLTRSGAQYRVQVKDGPLVSRHRPSVDVLFRSVAHAAGPNALGIIMTGMGDDGAAGMREMHDAGAHTIAQDEASSVVYGMPKEAVQRGGVERSLNLEQIAQVLAGLPSSV